MERGSGPSRRAPRGASAAAAERRPGERDLAVARRLQEAHILGVSIENIRYVHVDALSAQSSLQNAATMTSNISGGMMLRDAHNSAEAAIEHAATNLGPESMTTDGALNEQPSARHTQAQRPRNSTARPSSPDPAPHLAGTPPSQKTAPR